MPWPPYTRNLRSPLDLGDDFTTEVPARLAAICTLYDIDQNDPLWERRLMMVLLKRHVRGFGVRSKRLPDLDDGWIIEIIDTIKDHYEAKEGRRPSTEAAVADLVASHGGQAPIAGKGQERLMRIYSGRNEKKSNSKYAELFARFAKAQRKLMALPADSHARILGETSKRSISPNP